MPAAQRWQKTAKIPVVTGKCPSGRQKVLTCQNKLAVCNQVHGTVPTHAGNSPKHVFANSGHWGPTQRAKHASSPWGPQWPPNSEAQLPDSEAKVENFKSVFGWSPAHACGCNYMQPMFLGAFIGRLHVFCTFLMNLINLSSAAMATEFAISRPMAQRPELAFGCCFGVGSPAQAAHFRAHPTSGASTLARWHAGRPKKEISVKCRPAPQNA